MTPGDGDRLWDTTGPGGPRRGESKKAAERILEDDVELSPAETEDALGISEEKARDLPRGGRVALQALAAITLNDGMTAEGVADEMGIPEGEAEELVEVLIEEGLVMPPPRGVTYVGDTGTTLPEAAEDMGMSIPEAQREFQWLEKAGMVECIQISENELLISPTRRGAAAAEELRTRDGGWPP